MWKHIAKKVHQVPDIDNVAVPLALADEQRLDSAMREQLGQVFSSFYDSLFDAACAAGDAQQQHYLVLLHRVKAQQAAIIDGTMEDVVLRLAKAQCDTPKTPRSASETPAQIASQLLQDALTQRCETLSLDAQERLLLELAFAQHKLAWQAQQGEMAEGGPRGIVHCGAEPKSGAGVDNVARMVSRFRDAGLKILLCDAIASFSLEPTPEATAPEAHRKFPRRRLVAAALIALPMISLALWWSTTGAPAVQSQQQIHRSSLSDAGSVRDDSGQAVNASLPPELLATQVHYLLRRGDAALAALRLSEPFPDSAAANYFAALAIDPLNSRARAGLEQIVARYVELARTALLRGEIAQAQLLLERARAVVPQGAEVEQLERDIAATCTMRVPQCAPNFI